MKRLIILMALSIITLSINPVFAIECPKFPEQAKKDWEVKVVAEVAKIGPLKGAELNTTTRNVTQNLFTTLPDAGRVYLEQMMLAAYCSTLRDDKTISESEKSQRLKEYIKEVREAITSKKTTAKDVKGPLAKNTSGPPSPIQATVNQTSNAPNSQNIIAGTFNNISGFSPTQMDEIRERFNLIDKALKIGKTGSDDAKKNIEFIEKELSKMPRQDFDSLPDDSRKWVQEVRALLETYRKRDALIEESLNAQLKHRENLSQQVVVKLRDFFIQIISSIDSRVLALQEAKDLGIEYTRKQDIRLFVDSRSSTDPLSVGMIRFKNGSLIDIILVPGTLVQGIANTPPKLLFYQMINNQKSLRFSVKERDQFNVKLGHGDPPPLVPPVVIPEVVFNDIRFDPRPEIPIEDLTKQVSGTFTQLIGYVLSQDLASRLNPG